MMKVLLVLCAVLALASAASVGIAHLKGTTNDPNIDGLAYFVQVDDTHHWVWVNINGITVNASGTHGLHVHAFGDITDPQANSAGGHFVGGGNGTHACEDVSPRHEGDMGNWQATNGTITGNKTLDLLATTGNTSIIGKAVVLHQLADDCKTQPTGASGTRIAVGVIGIADPTYLPAEVVAAAGGAFTSNAAISADSTVLKAVAVLTPTTASSVLTNVHGTVTFEQDTNGQVTVTGMFTGLPSGKGWGLHIHTYADYYTGSVVNGTAAGGHFELNGNPHGAPTNLTRHSGDLGNICSYDSAGNAYYKWTMTDARFTLNGANNILGRNLIIHDQYDTMVPSSVFGQRAAQGVIGVLNNTAANVVTIPTSVTVSDPLCASVVPTNAPTAAPTAAPTSSSSIVALCYVTLLVLLAVVLF
eukprot:Phypoly_transcript_08651.p1 GENE.Phypoly_transcript_08651~~Phypoly_transcript_08651.p1  ORF type:complete len:416 (+),score=68.97 Phypoly_transcript_08651:206-1453(+)